MRKEMAFVALLAIIFLLCFSSVVSAQFSIGGQLRFRTELRDGYGTLLPKTASSAIFTSQRTRIDASYTAYRVKFFASLQDVRVWGQDGSTINTTTVANNDGLQFHEAWAEISLTDTTVKNKWWGLKAGRQEIIYDDQRLLGNSDFLQQARTFDAAILKYEMAHYLFHLGVSYNQNAQNTSGTIYNPAPLGNYTANSNGGDMYKSFEYLYANKKMTKGNLSFLCFTDQFSKFHTDPITLVRTYQTGVWARVTTGLYFTNVFNKVTVTAAGYYQFGSDSTGQIVNAELLSGSGQYAFNKQINAGLGVDYYSGGKTGTTSNAFDPLYGTPHKFAGYMDYFYVASGFGKVGLADVYMKLKYKPSMKYLLSADLHLFNSTSSVTGFSSRNLGQELDLVGYYSATKLLSLEAAYCHYFDSPLLLASSVKNISNPQNGANWAYLSINVKI